MPIKNKVGTWVEPWHESSLHLLSADMREKVTAELQRWRAEVEVERQERELMLGRLLTAVDILGSAIVREQPFYTLDGVIDITARAVTEALHDIPASEAHTSEFWAATLANHRMRLRTLVDLGRLTVFDINTAAGCKFESGLPNWEQCGSLGLARSGMVEFARYQGVTIGDAPQVVRGVTKNQNTMLRVIAALMALRNSTQNETAISRQIEIWTTSKGDGVSARTVTTYIKEIEEKLGHSWTKA